eukprot:1190144-Prorocentrum_minimum.AAC.4
MRGVSGRRRMFSWEVYVAKASAPPPDRKKRFRCTGQRARPASCSTAAMRTLSHLGPSLKAPSRSTSYAPWSMSAAQSPGCQVSPGLRRLSV